MRTGTKDIAVLARSYSVLDYRHDLLSLVQSYWRKSKLELLSKTELHHYINKAILHNYRGEITLKAYLTKMFLETDVTAAFEVRVNQSRIDFVTINGVSKSFEIKSELDNLYKLGKQVSDYEKAFDENYIVIDEKHLRAAQQIIPAHYGIYILHENKLIQHRPSEVNDKLDTEHQLKLFTKKELKFYFPIQDITTEEIIINFTTEEINTIFKKMLKTRYNKRWNFLVENQKDIYEVDYQFFFHHNICPQIIYNS